MPVPVPVRVAVSGAVPVPHYRSRRTPRRDGAGPAWRKRRRRRGAAGDPARPPVTPAPSPPTGGPRRAAPAARTGTGGEPAGGESGPGGRPLPRPRRPRPRCPLPVPCPGAPGWLPSSPCPIAPAARPRSSPCGAGAPRGGVPGLRPPCSGGWCCACATRLRCFGARFWGSAATVPPVRPGWGSGRVPLCPGAWRCPATLVLLPCSWLWEAPASFAFFLVKNGSFALLSHLYF